MGKVAKIKEEMPEALSNPDIFSLAEQADMVQDLKALHDTEGGKRLVKLLLQDAINCMHRLRTGYQTMSHIELIAWIASMDSHVSTARLLIDAKDISDVLNSELEDALRE